jgi:hypothetical protein
LGGFAKVIDFVHSNLIPGVTADREFDKMSLAGRLLSAKSKHPHLDMGLARLRLGRNHGMPM